MVVQNWVLPQSRISQQIQSLHTHCRRHHVQQCFFLLEVPNSLTTQFPVTCDEALKRLKAVAIPWARELDRGFSTNACVLGKVVGLGVPYNPTNNPNQQLSGA